LTVEKRFWSAFIIGIERDELLSWHVNHIAYQFGNSSDAPNQP
jgi:hypothetical protein